VVADVEFGLDPLPHLWKLVKDKVSPEHPGFARCKVKGVVGEATSPPPPDLSLAGFGALPEAWSASIVSMRAGLGETAAPA
jgi:hypothetical protein